MATPEFTTPSLQPGMGAVLMDDGCLFRVWAPFAERVILGGDFFHAGNLEPIEWNEITLARDSAAGDGAAYFSAFVKAVKADSLYKYKVKNNGIGPGSHGAEAWKHDPRARDAVSFGGNSVVVDPNFDWSGDTFQMPGWNELVIYELHVGTFNHEAGKPVGTFEEAIGKLDYLRDMGINCVELMPAFDFDTATSMGYNTALPFAVDNAYGHTNAMKRFVKAAHQRGIAVIMDVVYNHWGPQGLDEGLGRFDGYFQNDKRGIYFYDDVRSFTPFGERPDFGRGEVRTFIRDNAMQCLDDLRADGLRLDSTIGIRRAKSDQGDNGEIPDGFSLLRYLGEEKRKTSAWKILIAEDLQNDDVVTRDAWFGGSGLDAQWAATFLGKVREMLLAPSDDARRASVVAEAVGKSYNGSGPYQRVIYVESHDEAKFKRITDQVAPGDAEGWLARKISALGAALTFTSAGIPMIFMGQEFLEFQPWNDGTNFALDFGRIGRQGGFVELYRRLIKLRRNFDNNTRGLRGGNTNVYWASDADGVVAFHRWDQGGAGDDVVVVANLRGRTIPSYNVGFPRAGTWFLRFNSDFRGFCEDFGNVGYDTTAGPGGNQNMPCNGNVGLGAYSMCVYSQ
jgi:1,4-alpha-glucan branching enzyme